MKQCELCGSSVPEEDLTLSKSGIHLCNGCMKEAKQFGMFGEPKTYRPFFFSYKGRMNRARYFVTMLVMGVLYSVVEVLLEPAASGAAYFAYALTAIMCSFPIVKRWHDINMSGANLFWSFVPLVNIITGLILLFKRGTTGDNTYGPDLLEFDI